MFSFCISSYLSRTPTSGPGIPVPATSTMASGLLSETLLNQFHKFGGARVRRQVQVKKRSRLAQLKGKTTVITGGGRGIGLALTRACVEAGGNVAVLDALAEPHEDFADLKKEFTASKVEYYKCVSLSIQDYHENCKQI